jgi:hypothetical protein
MCRAIWGFTLDDFTDDDLSATTPGSTTSPREYAIDFAAEQVYDLRDYVHGGCVAGWWGFTWMIRACLRRRSGPPHGAGTVRIVRRIDSSRYVLIIETDRIGAGTICPFYKRRTSE